MSYNSPHAALAHSVQATINGLGLSGIATDSIRVRKVPHAADFTSTTPTPTGLHAYPGILVIYSDKERDLAGVNDRDDIGYPLAVVFVSKDVNSAGVSDPEANDDLYLTWRQKISDIFRNQPYTISNYAVVSPLTFQTCNLEYGPIVDWGRWQKDQVFVGAMTLVFVLRKYRGSSPLN